MTHDLNSRGFLDFLAAPAMLAANFAAPRRLCFRCAVFAQLHRCPRDHRAYMAAPIAGADGAARSRKGWARLIAAVTRSFLFPTHCCNPCRPKNRIRTDSRDEAESGHPLERCFRSSICLGRLSSICSSRGAGLKWRISFFGISSICPEACTIPSAAAWQ